MIAGLERYEDVEVRSEGYNDDRKFSSQFGGQEMIERSSGNKWGIVLQGGERERCVGVVHTVLVGPHLPDSVAFGNDQS